MSAKVFSTKGRGASKFYGILFHFTFSNFIHFLLLADFLNFKHKKKFQNLWKKFNEKL